MKKILAGLGILFAIVVIVATATSSKSVTQQSPTSSAQPTAAVEQDEQIVFEIEGKRASSVNYGSLGSSSQANNVKLPWTKKIDDKDSFYNLSAINGTSSGDITCRIKRGSEVLAENTSSGPYAFVNCSGS